jgi:hypothetical protein
MGSHADFVVEAFTLLSIGILIIFLRTYARLRQVGIRNFEADDWLMLLVIVPYTIETALAYTVGAQFRGLTNSGMTDEERKALSPDSDEYGWRVGGSKIQVAGWVMYASVLWLVKAALCAFYFRLTVCDEACHLRTITDYPRPALRVIRYGSILASHSLPQHILLSSAVFSSAVSHSTTSGRSIPTQAVR